MNKLKIFSLALVVSAFANAQDLEPAKTAIDAEQFEKAKSMLKAIIQAKPSNGKASFLLGNIQWVIYASEPAFQNQTLQNQILRTRRVRKRTSQNRASQNRSLHGENRNRVRENEDEVDKRFDVNALRVLKARYLKKDQKGKLIEN